MKKNIAIFLAGVAVGYGWILVVFPIAEWLDHRNEARIFNE